jgi:predicted RNA-binding Zn-ribbon protein involved in translation (DUF1610 family)
MPATATSVSVPRPPLASAPKQSPSTITTVAWIAVRDMDLTEWSRAGHQLGVMDRCSPWWIGDWIRYGNATFGEKYSRVAKITGYDPQTLMNRVYVASRFEISRRRENLSWSHHDQVAALPPDQQEYWLDRAIAECLTRADLRLELRSRRVQDASSDTPDDVEKLEGVTTIACPNCGHQIPSSALAARLKDRPKSE